MEKSEEDASLFKQNEEIREMTLQRIRQEHQATIGLISDSSVIPSILRTPYSLFEGGSIIAMSLLDLPPLSPPPILGFSGMARSALPIPNNSLRPAPASILAGSKASFRPLAGPLLPTPFLWTASGYSNLEAPLNSVSPLLSL